MIVSGQQRPDPDPQDDTPPVVVPDEDREVVLDDDGYERAS